MSTPAVVTSALGHVRTPVYRNAYSLMLSNGLTSALGLVYWTIAAKAYPTEVMGASSAALSMMLFLSGAAQLNLRPALLRLLPESGVRAAWLVRRTYALTIIVSALTATLVFAGGAVAGAPWNAIDALGFGEDFFGERLVIGQDTPHVHSPRCLEAAAVCLEISLNLGRLDRIARAFARA